jgi:prepilin peptidase CpaA
MPSDPGLRLVLLLPLLAIAAASDLAVRRVPNWLNAAIAVAGVASQLGNAGVRGTAFAALTALVLGVVLVLPWRLSLMGAGDLKLAVAVACWLTPGQLAPFLFVAAIAGGILGIPHYLAALRRLQGAVVVEGSLGRALARGGAGRRQVPFGIAIALGGAAASLWRWP